MTVQDMDKLLKVLLIIVLSIIIVVVVVSAILFAVGYLSFK